MTDARPLGIFDSGVGGLTVLRAIHDVLPAESTIYAGDLAFFPYGPRVTEEVRARARALTRFMISRNVKALVVACNTATSAALPDVEAAFPGPVVGVVRPGAEEAASVSVRHSIGVVATEGTVRSEAYPHSIRSVDPACKVAQLALGKLVDLVESGQSESSETRSLVDSAVSELVDSRDCDTIVLGCTHFPLVHHHFERAAAGRARVIDSAGSTARSLALMLSLSDLLSPLGREPTHEFVTTAQEESFVHQARRLFGEHITARVVDVPTEEPATTTTGSYSR